jgi:transposase
MGSGSTAISQAWALRIWWWTPRASEVNRQARRAKTDRMDVEKLLAMLLRYVGGERTVWRIVRVPGEVDEHRRQLHRELLALKQDRTRVTNRIEAERFYRSLPNN